MTRRVLTRAALAALLAGSVLLQGCAVPGSPDYDTRFGSGWRTLQGQQVSDPAAVQRYAAARDSTDPRATREARERYIESFAAPPVTNVFNIGVGSGGSR